MLLDLFTILSICLYFILHALIHLAYVVDYRKRRTMEKFGHPASFPVAKLCKKSELERLLVFRSDLNH